MSNETVTDVLKYIWYLSTALFLRFKSIDEKILPVKISFQKKIFGYLYSAGAILVTLYMVYTTTKDYKFSIKLNIVTQIADLLLGISNNVSAVATVFTYLFYQNTLTELVNKLYEIDKKLKQSWIWKSYKNVHFFIMGELFFVSVIWISFFANFMFHCPTSPIKCLHRWFVLYTTSKMSQVMLLEFCAFVVIFKHKLNILNENLKLMIKQDDKDIKKKLKEIEIIHNEVLLTFIDIQKMFSFPLLVKIASQFINIFCSLYSCVFGYVYEDEIVTPKSLHDIFLPLILIILSLIETIMTVVVCEFTLAEYNRTKKLLYRIPVTRSNLVLIKRVNLLSLQLIHKKIRFTASGFFAIDGTLLHTIVGAVTVYLVMIIQFDMATEKENL